MTGRAALLVAVVGLLLLGASYFLFFVRPERANDTERARAPETLVLASTTGGVEIAGDDGVFRAARPGERLSERARIRTDDEGAAELFAGDGSRVHLSAATLARVDELRRELKRLSLGRGELTADVRDDPTRDFEVVLGDPPLGMSPAAGPREPARLTSRGGSPIAVAHTRGASFVARAASGSGAVAARRGEVILSARGQEVVIRTGQFSRLGSDGRPEAPTPLPESLFLKVNWPPATSNRAEVVVSGEAAAGARVKVAGHFVEVERDGSYRAAVRLPDGTHQIHVESVDLAGHVVDERSPRIVVDTKTNFTVHRPKWSK